jgi:hypothetical protein
MKKWKQQLRKQQWSNTHLSVCTRQTTWSLTMAARHFKYAGHNASWGHKNSLYVCQFVGPLDISFHWTETGISFCWTETSISFRWTETSISFHWTETSISFYWTETSILFCWTETSILFCWTETNSASCEIG